MIKKTLCSVLLALILISLVACSRTRPVLNIHDRPVPSSLTKEQVKDCIQSSLMKKKWEITEEQPGLIHAIIDAHNHSAKIAISYSEKDYSINYYSSDNLKYRHNKIHVKYNKWIKQLNNTIQKCMYSTPRHRSK